MTDDEILIAAEKQRKRELLVAMKHETDFKPIVVSNGWPQRPRIESHSVLPGEYAIHFDHHNCIMINKSADKWELIALLEKLLEE